jgi:hypothetical protein
MKEFRLPVIVLLVTLGACTGFAGARAFGMAQGVVAADRAVQQPITRCSAASLQGPYGTFGTGTVARTPLAFVGVLNFDGNGQFSGYHDENHGGAIGSATESGPYKLDPDCHGTIDFANHMHSNVPAHSHRLKMVVVDGGKEVMLLGVDTEPAGTGYKEAIPKPEVIFSASLKR